MSKLFENTPNKRIIRFVQHGAKPTEEEISQLKDAVENGGDGKVVGVSCSQVTAEEWDIYVVVEDEPNNG
jgi:hypothetical protein